MNQPRELPDGRRWNGIIIARIDELKDEIRTCADCNTTNQDEDVNQDEDTICHCSLYEDEREELKKLEEFAEEASGYAADWAYGETIIRDSYFQEQERKCTHGRNGEDLGGH